MNDVGRTMSERRRVPLLRRQLLDDPARLGVAVLAVAAAIALVLLLTGLRRGIAEQVGLYLNRGPALVVGQSGTRTFIGQTSVLPESVASELRRVPGVAQTTTVTTQFAMLTLHGRRVLPLLIGFDPGRGGGPWAMAAGRPPRAPNELVLDEALALEHGIRVGSSVEHRGTRLRIVGLSRGTAAWMTPLAFTTRATANALSRRPGTASFFLVRPRDEMPIDTLAAAIEDAVPGVAAVRRSELVSADRRLFTAAFDGLLRAMVVIAFAVSVLVIGLTVYSATAERSREYATLEAIGLGRPALLRLVVGYAVAVAAAGAALGTLFAVGAVRLVAEVAPKYLIVLAADGVARMTVAAIAMALFAAMLPARLLLALDPATSFGR